MKNLREEIKRMLEENTKLNYLGVRTIDATYSVGDIMDDSYDWDFENGCSTYETENPISLGGACATDCTHELWSTFRWNLNDEEMEEVVDSIIEKIEYNIENYPYENTYLIGSMSNNDCMANDEFETIMVDAQVLLTINQEELSQ